jgi:hypothetical protein
MRAVVLQMGISLDGYVHVRAPGVEGAWRAFGVADAYRHAIPLRQVCPVGGIRPAPHATCGSARSTARAWQSRWIRSGHPKKLDQTHYAHGTGSPTGAAANEQTAISGKLSRMVGQFIWKGPAHAMATAR